MNYLLSRSRDNEVNKLYQENQRLREELRLALNTAASVGKEQHLHLRLAKHLKRKVQKGGKFEDISCRCRSSDLVEAFKTLYSQQRVEVLDALSVCDNDVLNSDQLKSKLIFSIIVLAFRSAHAHVTELKSKLSRLLQIDYNSIGSRSEHLEDSQKRFSCLTPTAEEEIVESIDAYIRKTVDTFDISPVVQSVEFQIWTTLQEHIAFLKGCRQFLDFINQCCRTAWGLVNQTPPFLIEFRVREFDQRVHERFHTSANDTSDLISEYIWPALIDSGDMTCSAKGYVVTGLSTSNLNQR
ncbi:hypothetical protein ACOME3_008634 [Neoechinorhynchus agilis]